MPKQHFDVGVVIALREEFDYVAELSEQLEPIPYEGSYLYRLELSSASAVCCLAGEMGTLPALYAATHLLGFADVKILVLLGLAGALDDCVEVGDVVIAGEVNEFQASSKAQSTEDGYEIHYSGRHWSQKFAIGEAVKHFEYACPDGFRRWQTQVEKDFEELTVPSRDSVCSLPATLHIGPIASGNIVAASSAFVDELKRINRKFLAIDMEAAGVTFAATKRVHPVPWLVARGISDRADKAKKTLDNQEGAWRRYSVRNALGLLKNLLSWSGFQAACGLDSPVVEGRHEHLPRELILKVRSCVGGPWLVGVAFDLYSHGPRIERGRAAIPMDLSRLCVLDPEVAQLLTSSLDLREQLLATGDLETAARGLSRLADDYRTRLDSTSVDKLLQDFDRVVIETLCPTDDEQIGAALVESDRLEEAVGPAAAAEFLSTFVGMSALRERYVEMLSVLERWPVIIDTLQELDLDAMSRGELENLIFAYARTDEFGRARDALALHCGRYNDNGARMLRQQLTAQFTGLGGADS